MEHDWFETRDGTMTDFSRTYYDCVRSLQELPMYFEWTNFKGDNLKPFKSLWDVKSILNMAEFDNPPS